MDCPFESCICNRTIGELCYELTLYLTLSRFVLEKCYYLISFYIRSEQD